ncbi:MAG: ribbon-helix-helix domain-containing protein [Coxiellaceae bacterium]|nr:ribbon-helix-helix domain-containing protein [Coxiellaceae bacterium]
MSVAKIAISIDQLLLKKLDYWVKQEKFENRSQAIQLAIEASIVDLEQHALSCECEKLNRKEEQKIAEEGLSGDADAWEKF